MLSLYQSQFTPPCKAFLSDPLPCLTILPSDLIVGNSATATGLLPSLPVVVPVPSLVKEEGSAFILSWVHALQAFTMFVVFVVDTGPSMGRVMMIWWSCWFPVLDLGRVGFWCGHFS